MVWPILSFQKKKKEKDRTAFNLRFTYQNFYPETMYTLKYFIQNSTKSTIHFFLYLHHFRKIESDNTGLPIKKERSIFFKSTYGSNYVAFSDMSRNFRSRYHTILTILLFEELYISLDQKLFFLLQIFLKNTNQKQYGLTHNYPFTKTWPILSKAHVIRIVLHFPKYLAKPGKNFNHGQYGLTQIVHLEKIDQIL